MPKKEEKIIKWEGCNCKKCPFYKGILVKPFGNINAEIYVRAESPGYSETKEGIPLIGDSGKLFRKILKKLDIPIKDCYLDNTCLCRPTNNKTPTPLQASYCGDHTYPLIKEINPKIVILLGAISTNNIFGDKKFAEKRGVILKKDGITYLPIYHPVYCLRNKHSLSIFENDLNKINRYFKSLEIKKDYLNCISRENIEKAKQIIDKQNFAVYDIETNGLNFRGKEFKVLSASFCYKENKAIGIPLFHKDNKLLEECLELYKYILSKKDLKLVTHSNFDYEVTKHVFGIDLTGNIISDTLLMQYLLDENRNSSEYALKHLSWELLDFGGFEFKSENYENEDLEELLSYNNSDTDITYQLFFVLHEKIKENNLIYLNYKIQSPASLAVADMELNGVKVDIPYLENLNIEYVQNIEKIKKELLDFPDVPKDINFSSPKQLRELFFEDWGWPIVKVTNAKDPVPSTDHEVLVTLAKNYEFPKKLVEYRFLEKFRNTYIESILNKHQKEFIFARYLMFITKTGRLSGSSPNLQNIPKKQLDIRKAFISRFENGKIISGDYCQMEIRMLANITKDRALIKMFKDGIDPHIWAASIVFNIPMNKVTKELRNKVKSFDFGIFYGKTAMTVAKDLNISYKEGEKIVNKLLDPFPDVKKWIANIHSKIRRDKYIINLFGRRRRFIDYDPIMDKWKKEELYRQGQNFPIQSCHDIILYQMIKCNEFLKKNKMKSVLQMETHDELTFDTHPNERDIILKEGKRIMEDLNNLPFDFIIPLEVEMNIGNNWGEMKLIEDIA